MFVFTAKPLFIFIQKSKEMLSQQQPREKRLAVYPGTFDPITMGHIDIINRALTIFDELIIAVARNVDKKPLFSFEERVEMIRCSFTNAENEERISVEAVDGLVVDFACRRGAIALVRGIRAVSDFDYEFQMALANRNLNRTVESVFLMPDLRWIYISSSLIKNIAQNGGDISEIVPEHVHRAVRRKFFPAL